jgi:hypothetical protein
MLLLLLHGAGKWASADQISWARFSDDEGSGLVFSFS